MKTEQLRQIRWPENCHDSSGTDDGFKIPCTGWKKIIGETLLLQGWSKQKAQARIIELLQDVGIPDPEDKLLRSPLSFPAGSGSVMIAMALALQLRTSWYPIANHGAGSPSGTDF